MAAASKAEAVDGPWAVEVGEQPLLRGSFVVEAVGERDQRPPEVPVLVEFVGRRGGVVDQVDEAVPATRFLRADEELGQVRWSGLAPLRARSRALRTTGSAARISGPATSPVAPSDFSATVEASEKGASASVALVKAGLARSRSEKTGAAASEKPSQTAHRQAELAQELGQLLERGFERRAAFGARFGGGAGVGEEAGDAGPLAGEGGEDLLGVGGELGEPVALRGEHAEQAVDIAQDRVGALDHLLDVLAAAGQAGAEFVEDEPEALRIGQPVDVVDQVGVDGGAVVLQRQQVLARPRLAVGDFPQRRRQLATPARAGGSAGSR